MLKVKASLASAEVSAGVVAKADQYLNHSHVNLFPLGGTELIRSIQARKFQKIHDKQIFSDKTSILNSKKLLFDS